MLSNEEILQQQIEALEKLLQLKEAVIEEQSAKIDRLERNTLNAQPYKPINYPINLPSVWVDPCIDGQGHSYPQTWLGTFPPPCTKCNRMVSTGTFTLSGNSNNLIGLGDDSHNIAPDIDDKFSV